jgi:hypothetical protein
LPSHHDSTSIAKGHCLSAAADKHIHMLSGARKLKAILSADNFWPLIDGLPVPSLLHHRREELWERHRKQNIIIFGAAAAEF